MKFFFTPTRTKKRPYKIMDLALKEIVPFESNYLMPDAGTHYVKYSWGKGKTIILVHGWAGKASHFTQIIEILVERGYRVITFDAPAHGQSDGKRTNLPEFAQIINEIAMQEKEITAIIGHSLGGIAASLAVHHGLQVNKLVIIASPLNMDLIFDEFSKVIPINRKVRMEIEKAIERISNLPFHYFSLDQILQKINVPILGFYDDSDSQANAKDAIRLRHIGENIEIRTTEKLGHQKILFDHNVINEIISELDHAENLVEN